MSRRPDKPRKGDPVKNATLIGTNVAILKDIEMVELNEAFAAQVLPSAKHLGIDLDTHDGEFSADGILQLPDLPAISLTAGTPLRPASQATCFSSSASGWRPSK